MICLGKTIIPWQTLLDQKSPQLKLFLRIGICLNFRIVSTDNFFIFNYQKFTFKFLKKVGLVFLKKLELFF